LNASGFVGNCRGEGPYARERERIGCGFSAAQENPTPYSLICECVKSHDKDLEKYVELFETKMVELETEQRKYEEKTVELKEARERLFSILPDNESVEVTTAEDKEKITKMMYDFITAIQGVQQGIISFRETHETKTDMDETIQNVEDVISATFKLLTTNDMR
jgi:hypothetical protein